MQLSSLFQGQDDDDSVGTQEYDDMEGLQQAEAMGQQDDSMMERMDDSIDMSPPMLNRKGKCCMMVDVC